MRDNIWLDEQLYELWENHFNDVPRKNKVIIKFGKKSKRQLGSIKKANNKTTGLKKFINKDEQHDEGSISVITITRLFKDEKIPEDVVLGTIAHEMCHYTHGFNSPLKQIYNHPHKGGVIRKEMQKRGLGDMYKRANKWLKLNWREYLSTI